MIQSQVSFSHLLSLWYRKRYSQTRRYYMFHRRSPLTRKYIEKSSCSAQMMRNSCYCCYSNNYFLTHPKIQSPASSLLLLYYHILAIGPLAHRQWQAIQCETISPHFRHRMMKSPAPRRIHCLCHHNRYHTSTPNQIILLLPQLITKSHLNCYSQQHLQRLFA